MVLSGPHAKLVSLLASLLFCDFARFGAWSAAREAVRPPLLSSGDGIRWHSMTFKGAAMQFRGCAEFEEWSKAKKEGIIGFVRNLDSVGDMSALAPLLAVEKRIESAIP
jgi:hypothetical protein